MQQNNTQQRQPQPIKMALETEEPKKIGESWSVLATAIVTQGNRTLEGRNVQFFLSGIPYDQPVQTDANGRAQIDITDIPMDDNRLSVEAQAIGQSARARKIITLPKAEKPKTEIRLEILATRDDEGVVHVTLVRLDKDGKGSSGKILYIDEKPTIEIIQTNQDGIAPLPLPKKDVKRRVLFFLPEKPDEKIRVDVAAKTSPKNGQTSIPLATKSFGERMRTAIKKGRQERKQEKEGKEKRS